MLRYFIVVIPEPSRSTGSSIFLLLSMSKLYIMGTTPRLATSNGELRELCSKTADIWRVL